MVIIGPQETLSQVLDEELNDLAVLSAAIEDRSRLWRGCGRHDGESMP